MSKIVRHREPMARLGRVLLFVLAPLCLASVAAAAGMPVAAVNAEDGVALKGYDPVAYFIAGEPSEGLPAYTYRWQGATYRFASAENRDRFASDPEKYAPRYGGYCAYAMARDQIADIDPHRWAIVDGKLYLNNNRVAQALWSLDQTGNIASADEHWAVSPKTGAE